MEKFQNEIIQFVKSHDIQSVCDYGCGRGDILKLINKNSAGNLVLTGVDYFDKFSEEYRPESTNEITFIDRSSEQFLEWKIQERVDLVITTWSLHHYHYPVTELKTIESFLKDEGYLYLIDLSFINDTEGQIIKNLFTFIDEQILAFQGRYHRHHYTLEEALDMLRGTGLKILESKNRKESTSESDFHNQRKEMVEYVDKRLEFVERNTLSPLLKDYFKRELQNIRRMIEKYGIEHTTYFKVVCRKDSNPK
jgi:2-polyprenyl-3-methyl-5-hydroxy-6-metoxy-1,4-benzoquinol methylase